MLKFLEDLYKAGFWESHPPLIMEKLGSRDFIQGLIESVAYRQGIGDLLAEGAARTADQIRNGWEFCAKYFPAYGAADQGIMRTHPGVALLWALDSRDPIIDQHAYLSWRYPVGDPRIELPLDRAKLISRLFGSEWLSITPTSPIAEMAVYAQTSCVINLLVVCDRSAISAAMAWKTAWGRVSGEPIGQCWL
jgi:aldehyde:ferredoxin oxidoreductase